MNTVSAFVPSQSLTTHHAPVFGQTGIPNRQARLATDARLKKIKLALAMSKEQNNEPRPLFRMPPADEMKNCTKHFPNFSLEELETNVTELVGQVQSKADELRKKGEDATYESLDRAKHVADPLKELGQEIAHNITRGIPDPKALTEKSLKELKENKFSQSMGTYFTAMLSQNLKRLGLKSDETPSDSSSDDAS